IFINSTLTTCPVFGGNFKQGLLKFLLGYPCLRIIFQNLGNVVEVIAIISMNFNARDSTDQKL
ncbi:MAG: hypothetical protein ACOC2M_03080, partial [bacterium]